MTDLAPTANAGDDQNVVEGTSVCFDGTSASSPDALVSTVWTLADATVISSAIDFCYTFDDNGVYTVTLTAIDDDDSETTDDVVITVTDTVPIADFSATPLSGVEALIVEFTDGSTAYDGVTGWAWDFGDGGISSQEDPTHTYVQEGSYTVSLTVTDSDGSTDEEAKGNYIVVGDTEPTAEFSCTPLMGVGTLPVVCTDESDSYDGVVTWEWEITCEENSYTSNEQNPSFSISQSGSCDVSLTIYEADDDSDQESKIDYLTIYDYKIELDKGWNLISIPLVNENDDTKVSTVFDSIKDDVLVIWAYTYDSVQERNVWTYHTVGGSFDLSADLQNVVPGYGYYVKMADYEEKYYLYLNGEIDYQVGEENNSPVMGMPPSVTLAMDSWNLIGFYGLGQMSVNNALVSLEDQDDYNYYDILYDKKGDSPDWMQATEGYWLSVKKIFAGTDTIQYKANYEEQN